MAYHIDHTVFPYGWLGVQVFFMLSGFLITRILLNTRDTTNYFSTFYIRRTLRIFPIYYISLLLVFAFTVYRNLPNSDFFYYIFYIQNYKLGMDDFSSQFPSFFNHTWSLGVEEQYYLFWPLIVKMISPKKLAWVCIAGIVISVCSKFMLLEFTTDAIVWTNLFGNLDMLCAGSLLAVILFLKPSAQLRYVKILAVLALVAYFVFSKVFDFGSFLSAQIKVVASTEGVALLMLVLFLVFAMLRYLVLKENKLTAIMFSNPVMRYIGRISYGIYLYHFILYYFIEAYFKTHTGITVISFKIILPILAAAISYHFFEKKILAIKNKVRYS